MKQIFVIFLTFTTITAYCSANYQNFYLTAKNPPKKLIPSTLNCTLNVSESITLSVDTIPRDADTDKIEWSIEPVISEIKPNGKTCTLTAKQAGEAILYARDAHGAVCTIKVRNNLPVPTISLDTEADKIKVGERAIIHATTTPRSPVTWSVEDGTESAISYGGSICKINASNEGVIKIRAEIEDTGVHASKTLLVETTNQDDINVDNLSIILLAVSGVFLSVAAALWIVEKIKNEKKI